MNKRSMELLSVAKNFIQELDLPVHYASVGGSVARGEADQYSDVDITVYTDSDRHADHMDILYGEEIIQLEIVPVKALATRQDIIDSPWDYRFLAEITIIQDRDGAFNNIKDCATTYFTSEKGQYKMIEQVSGIVQERIQVAYDHTCQQQFYSATNLAMGAWAEAGFLYLFLNHHSLSTGALIPKIKTLKSHFEEFQAVSSISIEQDCIELSCILRQLRQFLRSQGHASKFGLSELQDTLCDSKIQRLLNTKDFFNLKWQMHGEAFWLFLETSNGCSMEEYLECLPAELQKNMMKLGFVPLKKEKVHQLGRLTDELLDVVIK
ncbi:nucleotidyltransferase domain-containing protein [Bacillus sp. SD088]|uniref:nucleotidyltransferase domain-containing protein n=1 Tax=Bacillus sp. SD088 TaxID=2782012 RepID=UPI001A971EAA|nr:nucleotidyltransferase domain-containing protein [Bacillus sp. SD088]MBO0993564.1 nucleotidyltransferase domain-containing protein [Bacillus sp. SD088]